MLRVTSQFIVSKILKIVTEVLISARLVFHMATYTATKYFFKGFSNYHIPEISTLQ